MSPNPSYVCLIIEYFPKAQLAPRNQDGMPTGKIGRILARRHALPEAKATLMAHLRHPDHTYRIWVQEVTAPAGKHILQAITLVEGVPLPIFEANPATMGTLDLSLFQKEETPPA